MQVLSARTRRALVALLALALLLLLPGAPMRHAAALPVAQAHHLDCVGHAAPVQAAEHDHHAPTAPQHRGTAPDCCAAACPATVAVPAAVPIQPLVRILALHGVPTALPAPDGLGADPPIHPPRQPA
jgi:hypothetical protein